MLVILCLKPFLFLTDLNMSWLFGYVEKQFYKKAKVNFKFYGFTHWIKSNYNTYIVQYLKKKRQPETKFVQLIEQKMRSIFLEKLEVKTGI